MGWAGRGRIMEEPTIVVQGALVASVRPSTPTDDELGNRSVIPEVDDDVVVDGFLMPGVVDRHVHIALADPRQVVGNGVTAVRDLGWVPEITLPMVRDSESPSFDGPLIRAVGPIITCPGGYPTRAAWAPEGTGLEVLGAEDAAAAVNAVLDRTGLPVVKVALNTDAGPTLSDQELLAICDAAHARDAIVTVHAQGPGQAERAVGAGIDEFAHCPWSERLPDDLLRAMARRTRIVSTLDIHSFGRETPELRTALDNLGRFAAAGGRVAYGTDLGNGSIPPGIHVGEALLLHEAGLEPAAVLEALTFRPIDAGEPADLVVLGSNPLEDLTALGDVRAVFRAGRRVR